MKNFFKKHGKKVSVGLLATALMVSPMLNIVSASEDETCKLNYHYYFLEEEEAYIKTKYTLSKDIQSTKADGSKEDYEKGDTFDTTTYSTQYVHNFGLKQNLFNNNETFYNTNSLGYTKGNIALYGDGGIVDVASFEEKTGASTDLAANTNLKMISSGTFWNYNVPDGYKYKGYTLTNTWSKEDWENFTSMYVKAIHAASISGSNTLSQNMGISSADENYYFIHSAWSNESTESDSSDAKKQYLTDNGKNQWHDSDTTGSTITLYDNWAKEGDSWSVKDKDVQDNISYWQKASIPVATSEIVNATDLAKYYGDADAMQSLQIKIKRNYGDVNTNKPSDFAFATSEVNVTNVHDEKGKENMDFVENSATDTYAWYFFPTKLTVTFTAPAEYCSNKPVEENTGGDNVKTGVASYVIIGTLLVGAGSAYIYARKNNKFSKL